MNYTNTVHIYNVMYGHTALTMFMVNVNSSQCIPHSSCFCIPQSWPLHIILNKAWFSGGIPIPFPIQNINFSLWHLCNLIWSSNNSRSSIKSLTSPGWDFCLPFYLSFSCELLTLKVLQAQSFQCMQVHLWDTAETWPHAGNLSAPENRNITLTYTLLYAMYASLYDHLLWLFLVQLFNIGHCEPNVLIVSVRKQSGPLKGKAPKARTSCNSYP